MNTHNEPQRGGRMIQKAKAKSKQDAVALVLTDEQKMEADTLAALAEFTRSEAIRQMMALSARSSNKTVVDLILTREELRIGMAEALADMFADGKRANWFGLPKGATIHGVKYVKLKRHRLQAGFLNFGGVLVLEVDLGHAEGASATAYYEWGAHLFPGLELVIKALVKKAGEGVRPVETVQVDADETADDEDQQVEDG